MINDMIFMALRACIRNSLQLQDTTDQLPAGQPEEVEVTVAYQRDVAERLQKFFEAMGDPQTIPQGEGLASERGQTHRFRTRPGTSLPNADEQDKCER